MPTLDRNYYLVYNKEVPLCSIVEAANCAQCTNCYSVNTEISILVINNINDTGVLILLTKVAFEETLSITFKKGY